ncbi:hypothetical protein DB347_20700 [Opitutaceae bacterium EW11]|nr:hypothetical protein DB347_20700 [Opitutaceae bacterium EW11]
MSQITPSARFASAFPPRSFVSLALALVVLSPVNLRAQTTGADSAATPAQNDSGDETVVLNALTITGSSVPRRALETPLAITSLEQGQIAMAAPRSTADFLKLIPGLYTEASGGEAHNNVLPRGVFSSGGYRYTALLEDGLPVIADSEFQFYSADDFTRISNWIATAEGLRGGTSGVYMTNAAISTINFIGREGGDRPAGEAKIFGGENQLFRAEIWQGGPAGANASYAIGGFFRRDDGPRDPGYTANSGGQFAGNFKYRFANDAGYLKVSAKYLDDHTILYLPIPLTGSPDDPRTIPGGPDIHTGASASQDIRYTRFPSGTHLDDIDLADGIRARLGYVGTELVLKPAEGLRIENRNRFTQFVHGWNANPPGSVQSFQTIANTLATGPNTTPGQFAAALGTDGNYRYHLVQTSTGTTYTAAQAQNLNGNGLGEIDQIWHTERVGQNFQNDLRGIVSFNDNATTITVGGYYSDLRFSQLWNGANALLDVSNDYRRYDLVYEDALTGASVGQYTYNGLTGLGTFNFAHRHEKQRELSGYVNLEEKLGPLTLDAGLRHTHLRFNWQQIAAVPTDINPPGGTTPALRNVGLYTGEATSGRVAENGDAYTAGANYKLTSQFAVFGRYSKGPRFHDADNAVGFQTRDAMLDVNGAGPIEKISQYELGLKHVARNYGVYVTLYQMQQDNLLNNDYTIDPNTGQVVYTKRTISMKTSGVEVEGTWTPLRGLVLDLRATLQDPKIQSGTIQDPTSTAPFSLKDKVPTRLPKAYGSLGASYSFTPTSWGVFSVSGMLKYTGRRPTALDNKLYFSSFTETNFGVALAMRRGLSLRVDVQNAFNSDGITEGDPRASQSVSSAAAYFNARPILPRTIVASIAYQF